MPSESVPARRDGGQSLYFLYVMALGVALAGNLVIRVGERNGWLAAGGRAVFAVAASLPLAAAAVLFWRLLRRDLDELLQRIVLEGLAFGLIAYVPIVALYINLRTAGVSMPRLDPPEILMAPALLVAVGIALANRRYQ